MDGMFKSPIVDRVLQSDCVLRDDRPVNRAEGEIGDLIGVAPDEDVDEAFFVECAEGTGGLGDDGSSLTLGECVVFWRKILSDGLTV